MSEPSLRLSGISKRYPGVQALREVSLECVAGEVHAVLGENGSGKSTLLKIASGALMPDDGTIEILGNRLASADTSQAHHFGLATVYQDNSLVPELTVAQNIYLGTMDQSLPYRRLAAWAEEQLAPYDLAIDSSARVADLSPAQRQFLEVVKALVSKPEVLLLDEPTASLDVNDVDTLHRIVRRIVAGGTTVVYVSHRLPEILSLAQRVTVLRDGEGQGTFETHALSEDDLIALMVGRPIEAEFPPKRGAEILSSETCLALQGLSGDAFSDVAFEVHRGEILGLAGAEGNGQREVLRAIGGFEDASGVLSCEGRRIPLASPQRALGAGVMMLSGDRAVESIYPAMSVRENITIQVLKDFATASVISGRKERARTREMIEELDIVTASLDQPIVSLSGGNQQKSMLARSFLHGARMVLIDEPTQGVDAAARFDIYQAVRAKADSGTTFVINSSDALELAGLCDRVLVFSRGRLIKELTGDEVSEQNIVSSFLTSRVRRTSESAAAAPTESATPAGFALTRDLGRLALARDQWWTPLGFLLLLIVLVGAYASSQSDTFLSPLNGRHLLLATAPLALVAMAQLNVLLVGGFDMSVGSLMSVTVVAASFLIGMGVDIPVLFGGTLACLGIGVFVGVINGGMVRRLHINPVITTIAMLSVLQGVALHFRPVPTGLVEPDFMGALRTRIDFLPVSFLGLIALAVLGDLWLYRTKSGLRLRAVGFHEEAARRNGIRTGFVHVRAYVISGGIAALAGLFLSTEVGVGHPTVGATYTLTSIAAAVLGGAALSGGRGSFSGALLGAIFFTLIVNIMPFLAVNTALGVIVSGALTLLAVLLYSGRLPTGRVGRLLRVLASRRSTPTQRV